MAGKNLPVDKNQIGTLHAHAYRSLGGRISGPKLAEDKDTLDGWNSDNPQYRITTDASEDIDAPVEGRFSQGTMGDAILQRIAVLRARETPIEMWPANIAAFHKEWTEWKRASDVIDFTDMLELAITDTSEPNGSPTIFMVDEAQDLDRLGMRLVRHWGEGMKKVLLVGDPDQCQPAGTMVRTTHHGEVPIENLDPDIHELVSWDAHSGVLVGRSRKGYNFTKSQRHYTGPLLVVATGSKETECTPEHKWLARWNTKTTDLTAVYIMQQGERYRVGWCQLFNSEGSFHLGIRCRLEKADNAWILKIFEKRSEAAAYESYVSARYGIPTITFEPRPSALLMSEVEINFVFDHVPDLFERASDCLRDHDRDIAYPLYIVNAYRGRESRARLSKVFRVAACNLESKYMSVPEDVGGRTPQWMPIEVARSNVRDKIVYSLAVDKYETYIADGMVTHNCLYSWRGSDAGAFVSPPIPAERRSVLGQSYRVPDAVRRVAVKWIEKTPGREPVDYTARREDAYDNSSPVVEGEVLRSGANYEIPARIMQEAQSYLDAGKTVMVLTSCGYMLKPLISLLRSEGIPFHNPYRTSRYDWNPLGGGDSSVIRSKDRVLAYLRPDDKVWGKDANMWTWADIYRWADVLESKGVMKHGAKAIMKKMRRDPEIPTLDVLRDVIFLEDALGAAFMGDLGWYENHILGSKRPAMRFPLQILKKRGSATLRGLPKLIVGTVHSVKGGEADAVFLCPDLSAEGGRGWSRRGSGEAESVRRMFYVGATRPRESLIVCSPATDTYVNLLSRHSI